MIYVLLMVFPLAMAGGSFVLRRQSRLVTWAGVITIVLEGWLALSAPIDQPARLLEISISYNALGRLFLVMCCLGSLIGALMTIVSVHGEHFIATALLILSGSAAILIIQEPFVVAALLLLTSLLGGIMLVDQPLDSPTLLRPQTIGMALKYTLLIVLGGLLLLIGFILTTAFEQQLATTGPTLTRVVFGLLLAGYCVRVGLIPFHLWLPDLVDDTPPVTILEQTGLLTVLAVPVLLVALQTQPQLLVGNASGQRLMIGLGGLSAVLGGAMALLTRPIRRAIAFLTIANLGLITVGLGLNSASGVTSALLGALNHVLGMALLMLGLALLERPTPGRREQAGAMRERPLAALAVLAGVLVLAGVPPLSGFAPKLLLIVAGRERGWLVSVIIGGGLLLSGMGGARLLQRLLLQPRETATSRSFLLDDLDRLGVVGVPYAPRLILLLILVLILGSLVAGVWPQPMLAQINETVRGLTFLSQ
jgi:formate hydrogenlyase subunit 3/multisubunit Na+/H+ antiporter MnhD subunit